VATAHWDQDSLERRKASMIGLGVALAWLFVVSLISYAWAGGFSSGHEGPEGADAKGAPPAATAPH
jgi:hypothetical protein